MNNSSERNELKGISGLKRLRNAVKYSFQGYRSAWSDEDAFRQIVIISLVTIPSALCLGEGFSEKVILLLPSFICIIVELLNSAIENTVDRISIEKHDLSKKAKDMGSAAQFTSQVFLCFTWIMFFVN